MSAIKPIIREVRQAVLKGMSHAKHKLHQVADRLDNHLDDVVRKVKGNDHVDGLPDTPRAPDRPRTPGDDALIPRPETLGPDGNVDWSPAPHNGFVLDADGNPIKENYVPAAGERFDRYGDPGGRYVSPVPDDGPFSYDSRSLPYTENPNAYHEYEWVKSPADVQSAYDQLDDATRADIDTVLANYEMDLSDLSHVARGEAAPIPQWGTSGGATQDVLPLSVDLLAKMGMIREVG